MTEDVYVVPVPTPGVTPPGTVCGCCRAISVPGDYWTFVCGIPGLGFKDSWACKDCWNASLDRELDADLKSGKAMGLI